MNYFNNLRPDFIVHCVVACCVLHNIYIDFDFDATENEELNEIGNHGDDEVIIGQDGDDSRRTSLFDDFVVNIQKYYPRK